MKNKVFRFETEDALEYAKAFFEIICGFDMKKTKHRKMMEEACELLEPRLQEVELKAICTRLGKEVYKNNSLKLDKTIIRCNGFSWINDEHVQEVYMCAVTAGNWHLNDAKKAVHQVYMDSWGTAFVDSAKILLENRLKALLKEGERLSDPFGPGYYGMPSTDTHKFKEIIDMRAIGIEVMDSGIMVPLKTMAAIYIVSDEQTQMPPMSCSECFGKIDGCRYCKTYSLNRDGVAL